MDQPPQQHGPISPESIIASVLSVVATLGAIAVRGKFRLKALREKADAEAAPKIELEYLEKNDKITAAWQAEVDKLRIQIDKVREEGQLELRQSRSEMMEWMKRALTCEARVPALEAEIKALNIRVADLEKQIAKSDSR